MKFFSTLAAAFMAGSALAAPAVPVDCDCGDGYDIPVPTHVTKTLTATATGYPIPINTSLPGSQIPGHNAPVDPDVVVVVKTVVATAVDVEAKVKAHLKLISEWHLPDLKNGKVRY